MKVSPQKIARRIYGRELPIVAFGVSLAVFFWIFDSWVDATFFTGQSFLEELLPEGMELYMRIVVTLMLLLFGFVTSRYVESNNRLNEYLHLDSDVMRKKFKILYENAPVAVLILDPDLHITDWNPEAEKLFGWTLREVQGMSVFDLILPLKLENKKTSLDEMFKHHGRLIGENISKNGCATRWNWRHAPVQNERNEISHVVLMAGIPAIAEAS